MKIKSTDFVQAYTQYTAVVCIFASKQLKQDFDMLTISFSMSFKMKHRLFCLSRAMINHFQLLSVSVNFIESQRIVASTYTDLTFKFIFANSTSSSFLLTEWALCKRYLRKWISFYVCRFKNLCPWRLPHGVWVGVMGNPLSLSDISGIHTHHRRRSPYCWQINVEV